MAVEHGAVEVERKETDLRPISCNLFAAPELDAHLADDLAPGDVAEDVLLDLLVGEVRHLDRRRHPVLAPHFTPNPPLTSV